MKVIVALDPDYGARVDADVGDAFWLVESVPNRALAERAWVAGGTDPNSAVFQLSAGVSADENALDCFDDIDLHHPAWTEIAFIDLPFSVTLEQCFGVRGLRVAVYRDGVSVLRPIQSGT